MTQEDPIYLHLASDEQLVTEMVKRAKASHFHGLIVAACRPSSEGVVTQVHCVAGSHITMQELSKRIADVVSEEEDDQVELKA